MRPPFRAVLTVMLFSAGCASTPAPKPATSSPVSAVPPASMDAARKALAVGHLVEATDLFERLAMETRKASDRAEALERAAFLRADAQAGVRDLSRARQWIAMRRSLGGPRERLMELDALEAVIVDVVRHDEELRVRLDEMKAMEASLAESRARGADLRTLRASNAALQAELTKVRAEVRQKDEALKKIAASLAGNERGSRRP